MKALTYDLRSMFNMECQLSAPLFQRPYVWQQEEQWEPLWNDIRRIAEALAGGESAKPHFLGAVVLEYRAVPLGKPDARWIIDGQQRLTTLQLLMEAVRDLGRNDPRVSLQRGQIEMLVENRGVADPDERFKVWPTNVDRPVYRAIMETANPEELWARIQAVCDGSRSRLAEAYEYFHDVIRLWLDPAGSEFVLRYQVLVNTIREKLRLVVIDMDEQDDAQVIFETLNARGTPLLPSDLVKNFLFFQAQQKGENVDSLYAKHWETFDSNDSFWREEVGIGRLKRPRIDIFLQHFLSFALNKSDSEDTRTHEVVITELFREYQRFAEQNRDRSIEWQLSEFSRLAKYFKQMEEMPEDSAEGLFFARLRDMQTTTVYPLLLGLFDSCATEKQRVPVLKVLESYLVRRMVCRLTTQGYNKLFLELLRTVAKQGLFTPEAVTEFLVSQNAESTRWPDDAEVHDALLQQPLYTAITRPRLRFVLRAIDTAMQSKKSEIQILKKGLTIEHLLPQHWQKHWPLVQSERESDEAFAERVAERNQLLHTIGNLTILNSSLNPLVSNGGFKTKKRDILKHSKLNINMFLADEDDWDEKRIRSRGGKLCRVFLKIWPRL